MLGRQGGAQPQGRAAPLPWPSTPHSPPPPPTSSSKNPSVPPPAGGFFPVPSPPRSPPSTVSSRPPSPWLRGSRCRAEIRSQSGGGWLVSLVFLLNWLLLKSAQGCSLQIQGLLPEGFTSKTRDENRIERGYRGALFVPRKDAPQLPF